MGIGDSFSVLSLSRQTPSSTTSNAAAAAVSEDCHGKEFGHTLEMVSMETAMQYRQVR